MSPEGRAIIVKRIELFAVVGGLLAVVAAYGSNSPMCRSGSTSSHCLASGGWPAGDATGSIQVERAAARAVAEAPAPRIARPRDASSAAQPRQQGAPLIKHIVIPGETLHSIARIYGTSVGKLANFNAIEHPESIKAGDTILIPRS